MDPVPAPLRSQVLDELARICAGTALRRSHALVRLLRHVVERHVEGDAHALREAGIALAVFRRDPGTYDPQADPIVRVTTRRLRERLAAHYAREPGAPLRIVLPAGGYVPAYVAAARAASRNGVAVLPPRNEAGDPALAAFCNGLAERLADQLARAGVARVLARTSVDDAVAQGGRRSLGDALDIAWLAEASLAPAAFHDGEPAWRITVRWLDARDDTLRWSESRMAGTARLHDEADRLVDAVVLRAGGAAHVAHAPGSPPPARLPEPQRNAIDAARLLLLQRTLPATEEAVALAEQVTAACPGAPAGWAALASALYSRLTFQDCAAGPLVARVLDAGARALALDPHDAVALRTRAIIVGRYQWQVDEAAVLFERALRVMPHYTSARLNYGELLLLRGEHERALAEVDLALVYDPLSSSVRLARALVLAAHARFDEARAEWANLRASGESSFWIHTGPARLEVAAGRLDAAQGCADEGLARFPDVPEALFCTAFVAAAKGRAALAREIDARLVRRFPHFSPTDRAALAAMLRDKRGVLQCLDEAIATRDMGLLLAAVAPEFAWLADDDDFRRRLNAIGVDRWRGRRRAVPA